MSDVSTLTHVFHQCTLPCDLSGQIVIEVTVTFLQTHLSEIFTKGLSHYTDTKDFSDNLGFHLLSHFSVVFATFVNIVPKNLLGVQAASVMLSPSVT